MIDVIILENCADPRWLDRGYFKILRQKKQKEDFKLIDETFPKWTNKKKARFFGLSYGYYLHLRRVHNQDGNG